MSWLDDELTWEPVSTLPSLDVTLGKSQKIFKPQLPHF